jgi:glycerophosphoryl diester phosphodiesterase
VRAAGYALLVYTVNKPADAQRMLGWGVDCIVTDALDRIAPNLSQES